MLCKTQPRGWDMTPKEGEARGRMCECVCECVCVSEWVSVCEWMSEYECVLVCVCVCARAFASTQLFICCAFLTSSFVLCAGGRPSSSSSPWAQWHTAHIYAECESTQMWRPKRQDWTCGGQNRGWYLTLENPKSFSGWLARLLRSWISFWYFQSLSVFI